MAGQASIGFFVGCVSAMVGIRGGTFTLPLLTLCNFPIHKAVGTTSAVGLIIALPGALTIMLLGVTPADAPVSTIGLVNIMCLLCIAVFTVLFAPLDVNFAVKINGAALKKVFAVILLIAGLRMLRKSPRLPKVVHFD